MATANCGTVVHVQGSSSLGPDYWMLYSGFSNYDGWDRYGLGLAYTANASNIDSWKTVPSLF